MFDTSAKEFNPGKTKGLIDSSNNQNFRDEIEKALQKLKKSEIVKEVYRAILNAIDTKEIDSEEDTFVVKRRFFTETYNQAIEEFANIWFVDERELHSSAILNEFRQNY